MTRRAVDPFGRVVVCAGRANKISLWQELDGAGILLSAQKPVTINGFVPPFTGRFH